MWWRHNGFGLSVFIHLRFSLCRQQASSLRPAHPLTITSHYKSLVYCITIYHHMPSLDYVTGVMEVTFLRIYCRQLALYTLCSKCFVDVQMPSFALLFLSFWQKHLNFTTPLFHSKCLSSMDKCFKYHASLMAQKVPNQYMGFIIYINKKV